MQRTPFQGFRNFSFNLSSRIDPICVTTVPNSEMNYDETGKNNWKNIGLSQACIMFEMVISLQIHSQLIYNSLIVKLTFLLQYLTNSIPIKGFWMNTRHQDIVFVKYATKHSLRKPISGIIISIVTKNII